MYQLTAGVQKIQKLRKRIRAVAGGTSASKTIGILLVLIDLAQSDKVSTLTSVVSESMPHMRKGAMLDFENIMKAHGYWKESRWSYTLSTYTFETGSKIEFFGAEDEGKQAGPRRQRLFINEANNVKHKVFEQMEVRTEEVIFLDWNPTNEFWFYADVLEQRKDDLDFITLTYKDNEALAIAIVKSIESRQHNKAWWQVYGLGQLGVTEGRIHRDWAIIDTVPHEAQLVRYGIDFGYYADPTVILAIYSYNGGYIIDEILYKTGNVSNREIADTLKALPPALVIGDRSETRSIDEIRNYGVNIIASEGGPGSVNQGISYVQSQRMSITSRSVSTIKDYRNYLYIIDRDGRNTNEPAHEFSHGMDAVRYGMEKLTTTPKHRRARLVGGDPVTGFGARRVYDEPFMP